LQVSELARLRMSVTLNLGGRVVCRDCGLEFQVSDFEDQIEVWKERACGLFCELASGKS